MQQCAKFKKLQYVWHFWNTGLAGRWCWRMIRNHAGEVDRNKLMERFTWNWSFCKGEQIDVFKLRNGLLYVILEDWNRS